MIKDRVLFKDDSRFNVWHLEVNLEKTLASEFG